MQGYCLMHMENHGNVDMYVNLSHYQHQDQCHIPSILPSGLPTVILEIQLANKSHKIHRIGWWENLETGNPNQFDGKNPWVSGFDFPNKTMAKNMRILGQALSQKVDPHHLQVIAIARVLAQQILEERWDVYQPISKVEENLRRSEGPGTAHAELFGLLKGLASVWDDGGIFVGEPHFYSLW